MKLIEMLYAVGLKPSPQEYTYDIDTIELTKYGTVRYAQWRHPKMNPVHFEDAQIDALRTFLKEGDVAIDVGSHTGDTTIPIALAVGRQGLVFAVEPNPYVFKVLAANVGLNVLSTRIVPLNVAAADRDGDIELEYSDPGFCNGGRHEGIATLRHAHFFNVTVRGVNLERYLVDNHADALTRLRYIKIDTEGYDLTVARSLSGVIASKKPFISAEVYRHTDSAYRTAFYRFLTGHGYRVHRFESDRNYMGALLSEQSMLKEEHFDIFATPENSAEL